MAEEQPAWIARASGSFLAAWADGDMDRCRETLVGALAACADAAQVEAVLFARGIDEVIFHDSLLWPEVAEVLVARARAMSPPDGARALGWLATLAALSGTAIMSAPAASRRLPTTRKDIAAVVDRNIELYRAWSMDASAHRRVAGAYLLASCANATVNDARALLSIAAEERSAEALATGLLTLGVVHDRLGLPGHSLRELATAKLAGDHALVRLSAAVALAFLADALSREGIAAILAHVTEPVALPPEWSWSRGPHQAASSDVLAMAVLPWARTDATEYALRALAALRGDPRFDPDALPAGVPPPLAEATRGMPTRAARTALGKTIEALMFAGPGRTTHRRNLAAEELGDLERLAVETLVGLKVACPALGLRRPDELEELLTGSTLAFRPIAIEVEGRARRWHFERILAAVAFEGRDLDHAREAVLGLSPADAADLVSRSWGRVLLDERAATTEQCARIQELSLSILATLRERGVDTDALFRAAPDDSSKSSPDVGLLAIACLRAHPAELPADLVPLVAKAIAQGWWKDSLLEHVRGMHEPSLREVLHAVTVNPNAIVFLALRLDDVVVRNLVFFTVRAFAPEDVDAVIRVLSGGGAAVARMIESLEYPNAQLREHAAPFVERALFAIQSAR